MPIAQVDGLTDLISYGLMIWKRLTGNAGDNTGKGRGLSITIEKTVGGDASSGSQYALHLK